MKRRVGDREEQAEAAPRVIDDALFRTRLIPPGQGTAIARPRLLAALHQATTKLVVVRAPAGFGKTTLMRQWHDSLLDAHLPVGWLSLDQADDDPGRLLAGLTAAFETAGSRHNDVRRFQSVDALIDDLKHAAGPFRLFLDQVDVLQGEASRGIVQMLLQQTPADLRVVIAGRSIPRVGQSRLRLADDVVEFGPNDLRFRLDETSAFLSDRLLAPLTTRQLEDLQVRTDGWAAALQLAILALRDMPTRSVLLRPESGLDHGLVEYLQEEVLDRMPEECRQFLLDTSVLRHLTADLCDALTGRTGSGALLSQLEADGFFLRHIEARDARVWYRFNDLFAAFLHNEARAMPPTRRAQLNLKASEWLTERGMIAEAAEHARWAGEPERALALLDSIAMEHIWAGRLRTVLGWSDGLTVDDARRAERLFGAYLWAEGYVGDPVRARRRLEDFTTFAASLPTRSAYLEDTLICLPILLAGARQEFTTLLKAGPRALAKLSRPGSFEHGTVANCVAYAQIAAGEFEKAHEALRTAKLAWHPSRTYNVAYTVMFEGHLHLAQLQVDRALATLSSGYARLAEAESELSMSSAIAASGYADALYEAGDAGSAAKLVARHLSMVEGATPDCVISLYAIAIQLAVDDGETDRALETVHRLEELGRQRAEEAIQRAALGYRASLHAERGEADAANVALDELEALERMTTDPLRSPVDALARDILRIRARLFLGQAERQLPIIEHLLAQDGETANRRRRLRLKVLKALALQQLGKGQAAREAMGPALLEGLKGGSLQAFLGHLPDGTALIRSARVALSAVIPDAVLARLDARLSAEQGKSVEQSPETDGELQDLTRRERDILNVLERGLTNREIAECFSLSETTVKWHLRNIFDKLGVGNRTEASSLLRGGRTPSI